MKHKVFSASPWEKRFAYSRARRVGNHVVVAGTVAVDESGSVVGHGDIEAQTRFIFDKITGALEQCGAQLGDVVRTRMYLNDISQLESVGPVHHEYFEGIDPVTSAVGVTGLAGEGVLIEIEADAIVYDDGA